MKILVRIPTPIQLARFSALALWQKENQPTTALNVYSKTGRLDEFLPSLILYYMINFSGNRLSSRQNLVSLPSAALQGHPPFEELVYETAQSVPRDQS